MGSSLALTLAAYVACFAVIALSGWKLANVADVLADRTGWGEAILGSVFVGAVTSLSGSVLSVTAAYHGHPELAVGNAVGGIGAQMAFLAIADIFYRKANLEHAAASQENLMQGVFLIVMLVLPLLAMNAPALSVFRIHPISLVMMGVYVVSIRLISASHQRPMWSPRMTKETKTDTPEKKANEEDQSLKSLWGRFLFYAGCVGGAGWLLSQTAVSFSAITGLSESLVGGFFTAATTSVPELIVAVAAVRRGALTLAVGDIVGGNVFDTLIIAASDIAYRGGSIYEELSGKQGFLLCLMILITGILLAGLLHREKHGVANIGTESVLMLATYIGGFICFMCL